MSLSVAEKTIIVTGAASGVGLAIAKHMYDKGANVVFVTGNDTGVEPDLDEATKNCDRVRFFSGDLRQKLTIANLISTTIDAFDQIDVLINASRKWRISSPLDAKNDNVEELWNENVLTTLRLCQAIAKKMVAQAEKSSVDLNDDQPSIGAILNLSSTASNLSHPDLLGYAMASAAIDQMSRSLAVALAKQKIRVNTLSFGSLLSASLNEALSENPDWREEIIKGTPAGRIASVDELVGAAQFLVSDASSFITGQTLVVDGGRSITDPVQAPGF